MRRARLSPFPSARFALSLLTGLLLALIPVTVLAPSPAAAQPVSAADTPTLQNTPLDMVILVDESGSESRTDIMHETEAAGTLAQAALNPHSRVTVFGFGGADGAVPNQNPIDAVCQPTVVNTKANLEYLAGCVSKLRARTYNQGYNTDYVAALTQAMNVLSPNTPFGQQSPAGAVKVIMMMTDGGLDESNNPAYPQPNWQTAAHNAVNLELQQADKDGVEVWPLGFGSIDSTDAAYLASLATGGGQAACDSRSASRPHSIIAQNSQAALAALNELFAAATCSGESGPDSGNLPPGGSLTLSVNIPQIASSGAISVNKGNPDIQVSFAAPDGAAVTGGTTSGGSTFQVSGENSAVEVLHITNPEAGPWQVKLTAPAGGKSQLVSVTAFWQGAAYVSLIPSPPSARPGQKVTITLSLVGQKGPITDPSALDGVDVQVTASGDGLSGPTGVPLAPASGLVGDFTGSFVAPAASGTVSLTGTASGYGLYATAVHTSVSVGNAAALTQGTVVFTGSQNVTVGQNISGYVLWDNTTGQSRPADLMLSTVHALATITSPSGAFSVAGGTSRTPFTIALSGQSPLGKASLLVKAVDPADSAVSYGQSQLLFTAVTPPGILAKYRLEIIVLLILIVLAILAMFWRRHVRRAAVDERGLSVVLAGGGGLSAPLRAPTRGWADAFRFMIRNEDEPGQRRLDNPRRGEADSAYVVRRELEKRRRTGRIIVQSPAGQEYTPTIGGPAESMPSGAGVAFRDIKMAKVTDVTGTAGSWAGSSGRPEDGWSRPQGRPEGNGPASASAPAPAPAPKPTPAKPDDSSDSRWM
jgi:hypothetical protein